MFANAQAAEQAGDIAEAERFYRMLMKGNDPSAAFNLGNMLRACGRNVEAEAAPRAAVQIDPTFAEAWYNLGDQVDEQGRSEAAIECLRKAVQVARPTTAKQCSTWPCCCNESDDLLYDDFTERIVAISQLE